MRNRWLLAPPVATMVLVVACSEGGSPTEPILREPTPTPTASDLVGQWHGTMASRGGDCVSEQVDATVSPEGSDVRLNVHSRCLGNVAFRLQEQPPAVSGSAKVVYDGSCVSIVGTVTRPTLGAQVSGTMEDGRLRLETTAFSMPLVGCTRPGVTLDLGR